MNLFVALVMSVTVYVPRAGGINGSEAMARKMGLHVGHAACGAQWKRGTVFVIHADLEPFGLSRVVECRDRGAMVGTYNLDLYGEDLKQAFAWGRRSVAVSVFSDRSAYEQHEQRQRRASARAQ